MNADLDLNDFDLINAGTVNADNLVVAGTNLNSVVAQAATSATNAATSASSAAASASTASQYTPAYFTDVAELLADTRSWPTGQILNTREEGFAYEVVTSGQHVTTAGGVKLIVLPGDGGVNVKAFGAVGNGTTNDAAAVQLALDSGATVVNGEGKTYGISSTLTVSSPVEIINAKFKWVGSLAQNVFSVTADSVTFQSVEIDGNNAAMRGIFADATNGLAVDRCTIKNLFYNNTLGLTSLNAWVVGVMVQGDCRGITVRDCTITNLNAVWDGTNVEKDTSTARGILCVAAGGHPTSVRITGNYIGTVTGSSGVGVHLLSTLTGSYFEAADYFVSGNVVEAIVDRAFKVQASNGSVVGNQHVLGLADLSTFLTTHSLANLSAFFAARASVSVIASENVSVSDNQFDASGFVGCVLVTDASRYIAIGGNNLKNTTARTPTSSVASLTGAIDCVYDGNTCLGGARGLYLLGAATGNTVSNNKFISPTEAGIYVADASVNNVFDGNTLTGTGTSLALLNNENSNGNHITGNISYITNIPSVRMSGTSEGCVIVGNRTRSTSAALAVSFAGSTAGLNGAYDNDRMNRLYEVSSWPIAYGKYNTGDVIKLRTGTPGQYLLYVCRFGGEYGTGTLPVFVQSSVIV
jgi:parallel beta-helix repeat protein